MTGKAALVVTPDLAENSLGRTFVIHSLLTRAGWSVTVASARGEQVWGPLRDNAFAEDCMPAFPSERALRKHFGDRGAGARFSIVVSIKALPESIAPASAIARALGKPLLVDYDDPDLEAWLPSHLGPKRFLMRTIRHPLIAARMVAARRSMSRVTDFLVSNPALAEMRGGGVVVPHARALTEASGHRDAAAPTVAFVGTARKHKGIEVLRASIGQLQDRGFQLVVTDTAPADAHPWESWVGNLPFEEVQSLLERADIVAVPSLDTPFSRGQLPAKLMDAMVAGRAIVASSLPPIAWALEEDAGVLVPPGDSDALARALAPLADRDKREQLGTRARERAIRVFSHAAVQPALDEAVRSSIRRAEGRSLDGATE